MPELSPAAEAVLNAVTFKRYDAPYYACLKSIDQIKSDVAAALRAATDQVVPEPAMILKGGRTYEAWTATVHSDIRNRLLAIANELEQLND